MVTEQQKAETTANLEKQGVEVVDNGDARKNSVSRLKDGEESDEAQRRLDDPDANEFEKIAARSVLRNPEYHEQEQPMKESSNGLFGTIYNQF